MTTTLNHNQDVEDIKALSVALHQSLTAQNITADAIATAIGQSGYLKDKNNDMPVIRCDYFSVTWLEKEQSSHFAQIIYEMLYQQLESEDMEKQTMPGMGVLLLPEDVNIRDVAQFYEPFLNYGIVLLEFNRNGQHTREQVQTIMNEHLRDLDDSHAYYIQTKK